MPVGAGRGTVQRMRSHGPRVTVTVIASRPIDDDGGGDGRARRRLTLSVDHPERPTYQVVVTATVPPSAEGRVFPGARLPAVAEVDRPEDLTIDWLADRDRPPAPRDDGPGPRPASG